MTFLQLITMIVYTCVWYAYKSIFTTGLMVCPNLVVMMVLSFDILPVNGFVLTGGGGGGGHGAMCWVTLDTLDLGGFSSGRGKEGLGMNESLESLTSTLLWFMILPFSS